MMRLNNELKVVNFDLGDTWSTTLSEPLIYDLIFIAIF